MFTKKKSTTTTATTATPTGHQVMTADQKNKLSAFFEKSIHFVLVAIILVSSVSFSAAMIDRVYGSEVVTTLVESCEDDTMQEAVVIFFELNHEFVNEIGYRCRLYIPGNDRNPDTYRNEGYEKPMGVNEETEASLVEFIKNK